VNIAIIDDHGLVRSCIARMLLVELNDVEEVVEANNVEHFYKKQAGEKFDIILLDYYIPDSNPTESFKLIKEKFPATPIMYISSEESPKIILDSLNNGAAGYVVKSSDMELFTAAIYLVMNGGKYIPLELVPQLTMPSLKSNEYFEHKLSSLSRRQKDVFDLLIEGYSNKTISEKLSISQHTVKSHVQGVYNTFGLKSRQEVVDQFNEKVKK